MTLHCCYKAKIVYAAISDSFHHRRVEDSTSCRVLRCSKQRAIGFPSAISPLYDVKTCVFKRPCLKLTNTYLRSTVTHDYQHSRTFNREGSFISVRLQRNNREFADIKFRPEVTMSVFPKASPRTSTCPYCFLLVRKMYTMSQILQVNLLGRTSTRRGRRLRVSLPGPRHCFA